MPENYKSYLEEREQELRRASKGALIESLKTIEGRAAENCPVDTGRLKGSIDSDYKLSLNGFDGRVGTNVKYAQYVEGGTKKMDAQPFLSPAFYNSQSEVKQFFKKWFSKI
jgi:HK97 gp10 family phage protein